MSSWSLETVTNPGRRPGAYINQRSRAELILRGGPTGSVAATFKSDWGPDDQVIILQSSDDVVRFFGDAENEYVAGGGIAQSYNAPLVLNSILSGGANRVIAHRIVGPNAVKAGRTIDNASGVSAIGIEALYNGEYGNEFTPVIGNVPSSGTPPRQFFELWTTGGVLLFRAEPTVTPGSVGYTQSMIDAINNHPDNVQNLDEGQPGYVSAGLFAGYTGDDALELLSRSGTFLSGGTGDEANITVNEYDVAQRAFEVEQFEIAYFDAGTDAIQADCSAWVAEMRREGKRIRMFTGSALGEAFAAGPTRVASNKNAQSPQSFTYVSPGTRKRNRANQLVTIPGYLEAASIAGIQAGMPLTESLTFASLNNVVDLERRPRGQDIMNMLAGGVVPLVWDGNRFKIERGITALLESEFDDEKDEYSQKLKTLRIVDNIFNSMTLTINNNWVGKINNNVEGRRRAVNGLRRLLDVFEVDDLIEDDYIVREDPNRSPTVDGFFLETGIRPIDSLEFFWMTNFVG